MGTARCCRVASHVCAPADVVTKMSANRSMPTFRLRCSWCMDGDGRVLVVTLCSYYFRCAMATGCANSDQTQCRLGQYVHVVCIVVHMLGKPHSRQAKIATTFQSRGSSSSDALGR